MFWKILSVILCLVIIVFTANSLIASLLFSNKKYENNILIEPFIMAEFQLCDLFENNIKNQLGNDKLSNTDLYLVICVKNLGELSAWGSLLCIINNRNTIKVNVPHIGRNNKKYYKFVIPYSGGIFSKEDGVPKIAIKWEQLYTK